MIHETQRRAPNGAWRTISYDLDTARGRAAFIARERYAFPGGYELLGVTNDGALLCSQCVRDNYPAIIDSARTDTRDGWLIDAIITSDHCENFERCDHCGTMVDAYHEANEVES